MFTSNISQWSIVVGKVYSHRDTIVVNVHIVENYLQLTKSVILFVTNYTESYVLLQTFPDDKILNFIACVFFVTR